MILDKIFKYFEEISKIPRGSGNEKAISDYLVRFAKENNLEVIQDEVMNVIIKKPASPGYENSPGVILQGHMDMVCVKNSDKVHDFTKDPITLKYVGDMIYADGTSLGADNGIAVALAMAVLTSDNISHPPLEALITVDEESGMTGAHNLNPENISGKILINLDSEEEGKLLVSCAGGSRAAIKLNVEWQNAPKDLEAYAININGLLGGHSGVEIDKERGNSNKLLGRALHNLYETAPFNLAYIAGGSRANVIPSEAEAVIFASPDQSQAIADKIMELDKMFKNEYKVSDPGVRVSIKKSQKDFDRMFNDSTTIKAISLLVAIPNGIQAMSKSIKGLVESSSNIGVVSIDEDFVSLEFSIRSSVSSLKEYIRNQICTIANLAHVDFEANGDYPAWEYNPNSQVREVFQRVYKEKYDKEPEIVAIHAGVECGLFGEKIPGLDMISIGANAYDAHTTNEHVSISSVKRTYEYLLAVLEELR
ncbi:MAG: aminoacyl-histidine dipeptidase [Lutispora sp.]|nr:aminoacyl-histidine dipeptidase [Lutispora sp.]MDD4834339.1 aminoacyl-histidine dipeptidase [Lutispora sp.]